VAAAAHVGPRRLNAGLEPAAWVFVATVAIGRIRPSVRAETTIYRARTRRRRQSIVLLQRAAVVLVVLVGVVAVVGIAFAGSPAKLAGGTTIGGLDVGGLTSQQAVARLRARERALSHVRVVFVADGTTTRYSASQLGVQADWEAAVAQAQQDDDGFWPVRGFRRLATRLTGNEITARLRSYPLALRYGIATIARKVDTQHRDASLVRHGLRIAVVPARPGQTLDRVATQRAVVAALGAAKRPVRVVLPVAVEPPTVTGAQLVPVARRARLALSAPVRLTYGGTTWRLPRWRLAPLLQLPSGGSTALGIGGPAATEYFSKLARRVDRKPVDATFRILAGNRIAVVPSKPGVALDTARTARALLAASVAPAAQRLAQLSVGVDEPARSTQDAQKMGITGLVSSFETTYGGTPGRLHNVALVAKLIDNTLIAPGAVFSFNGTTGARTADKGFEVAPVIINGELQNGLGGGVCQVSTTTFNAAFFAGLPILERTNHALYISHYPQGRDATVDYPGIDLKFRNDTSEWLLLRTWVGSGSLTVALYGTPQHRRVEYQTGPLVVTGAMPVKRTKDPSLKPGEQVVDQEGAPPRSTSVRRLVYDASGKLLYDTTWGSRYDGETELMRVGVKKKPKPPEPAGPLTRVT
jgi:vancomycin resistance protein YoaR